MSDIHTSESIQRRMRPDLAERNRMRAKHGLSGSPTMKSYEAMVRRCTNPQDKDYKNYGARGVTVCTRWSESFENFVADMGIKPRGKSLGRIDNDGDYSPENCQWEDAKSQANNRRGNKTINYRGRTQTVAQWADEIGIGPKTLAYRIRAGWSLDDAMSATVDRSIKRVS